MADVSRAAFSIAVQPEDDKLHEVHAGVLGEELIAFSQFVSAAAIALQGKEARATLAVTASPREGSLIIYLALSLPDGDTLNFLLSPEGIKSAAELLAAIGVGAKGLLGLLKWLRGRKPDKVEPVLDQSGKATPLVNIVIGSQNITVNRNVYKLSSDPATRDAAQRVVKPVRTPGIRAIEFRDEEQNVTSITRDDAADISASEELIELPEELLLPKSVRPAVVLPIKVWFEKGNLWQFSGGSQKFNADVADEDFLDAVRRGEVKFGHDTEMVVDLSSETFRSSKGLETRYVVERVLDVREPPRSVPLFPEGREE